jgi:hypothetical protein
VITTICTKCANFYNAEPGSVREHVWYNHLCKASPLPKRIDPYDGKMKSCSVNDLGRGIFTDHEFEYCREVNDGNCPKFKPKAMAKILRLVGG